MSASDDMFGADYSTFLFIHDTLSISSAPHAIPSTVDDEQPSVSTLVKEISIVILAGIAIFVGLSAAVYIMTLFFDKYCGSNVSSSITEDQDVERGTMTRDDAQLLTDDMCEEERRRILEQIFKSQPYTRDLALPNNSDSGNDAFDSLPAGVHGLKNVPVPNTCDEEGQNMSTMIDTKKVESTSHDDLNVCKAEVVEETEDDALPPTDFAKERDKPIHPNDSLQTTWGRASSHHEDVSNDSLAVPSTDTTIPLGNNDVAPVEKAIRGDTKSSGIDDYHSSNSCAICISEYEEGEAVIVGNPCHHMFHKKCLLEWLVKHDICPFCRENLITSTQLLAAAAAKDILDLNRRLATEPTNGTETMQQRPSTFIMNDDDDDPNNTRTEND